MLKQIRFLKCGLVLAGWGCGKRMGTDTAACMTVGFQWQAGGRVRVRVRVHVLQLVGGGRDNL